MATCRSCRADVIFVPSAKTGKSMILDGKPKKGVLVGLDIEAYGFPDDAVMPLDPDEQGASAFVVDVYTDHHVTCPKAKDWAGRTRKDPPG